jgi:hypothetical protein
MVNRIRILAADDTAQRHRKASQAGNSGDRFFSSSTVAFCRASSMPRGVTHSAAATGGEATDGASTCWCRRSRHRREMRLAPGVQVPLQLCDAASVAAFPDLREQFPPERASFRPALGRWKVSSLWAAAPLFRSRQAYASPRSSSGSRNGYLWISRRSRESSNGAANTIGERTRGTPSAA